jgi:oxalate decarboxylase/phosphoglucose isomerase-like protein (cupin superfamily)
MRVIDTGDDSLYLMYNHGGSWDTAPTMVEVHVHDVEDEMMIMLGGEGFLLHGPEPSVMVKTPYKGPCVLFIPAGDYHRLVTTSSDVFESFLTYSRAGAVIEPFDTVITRARRATVELAALPLSESESQEPGPAVTPGAVR